MVKVFASFLLAAVSIALAGDVLGQGSGTAPVYTVIAVENVDCHGCAKRIAGKLHEVPGVDKIQYDLDKKLFWVHPKASQQPSPRSLWEAVEKAKDRPTKLHGPSGVFTTKPQS